MSATFLKLYNNVNVSTIVIQTLKYKLNPLKPTIPTLNMLSMAFKLVENNLSPMQRSRSQVKEKQAFFKRLERSLLVNKIERNLQ